MALAHVAGLAANIAAYPVPGCCGACTVQTLPRCALNADRAATPRQNGTRYHRAPRVNADRAATRAAVWCTGLRCCLEWSTGCAWYHGAAAFSRQRCVCARCTRWSARRMAWPIVCRDTSVGLVEGVLKQLLRVVTPLEHKELPRHRVCPMELCRRRVQPVGQVIRPAHLEYGTDQLTRHGPHAVVGRGRARLVEQHH